MESDALALNSLPMQKSYLLWLLLSSLAPLCAQTSESPHLLAIVDDQGEPLIGVHIIYYDNDHFISGADTDFAGMAEIDLQGNRIEISYLGYQTEVYKPEELAKINLVELQPETTNLQTVEVVAFQVPVVCTCQCVCGFPNSEIFLAPENLEEQEKEPHLRIYPNPSTDWVQVERENLEGLVQLFSMDGRLVDQKIAQNGQVKFDLSNHAVGLYLVVYQNAVLGKVQRGSRGGGFNTQGGSTLLNW